MSVYERAPVDEATGSILLTPGRWFFDTELQDALSVMNNSDLLAYVPADDFRDQVTSGGRGMIMVEFELEKAVALPNRIAQRTGYWWRLPEGETLRDASNRLFGEGTYSEPVGFWEWLLREHPLVFKAAQKSAEEVGKVAKKASEVATSTARETTQLLGAAVVLVLLGYAVVKLSSRSTEPEGQAWN